ncbi:MAG: DUF2851 family protein [Bacteroidetes bacterium]|nr:DUF2851 family protein [Bacteroidota bacterium]
MTEEFLWHIWKFRLFDNKDLQTTSGEEIKILKVGEHNSDSGPDFFNARIKIAGTEWAGNVEIHTSASDWHKHKHTTDKAYDNIILHVVHEADEKLHRRNGELIPTLELKNKIPQNIYGKYLQFKSSKDWIPCEKQIASVDKFTLNNWLDRLLVERLERKSKIITDSLKQNKNNWEETFYQMLARNFGQKINSDPFELLSKQLPVSVLSKHKNNLLQIESLLFGTAGMLEKDFKDDYPNELKKEFKFLKSKFKLKPIDSSLWKFMRLHPPNFPTIRISQFANLIYKSSHLFSKILEAGSVKQIIILLETETSEYWQTHYQFDKFSSKRIKKIGKDSINTIIINTIVPFLFIYGKEKGEEKYCDNALIFLEKLDAENNSIISKWKSIGLPAKSSYETQALLQLKNEYCSNKKCLSCGIGNALLK